MREKIFITSEQLAKRWNLSPLTLRDWRADKKGPRYVKLGNPTSKSNVLYRVTDVEDFENKRTVTTNGKRRS